MDPLTYTDSEIIDVLTCGKPERLVLTFSFNDAIRTWHPKTRGYLGAIDRDPARAKACREYLRRQGQAFTSLEEVRAYGIANNFPNLEESSNRSRNGRADSRKKATGKKRGHPS
jgi:hypothetical protein